MQFSRVELTSYYARSMLVIIEGEEQDKEEALLLAAPVLIMGDSSSFSFHYRELLNMH